jgi:PqqD family protein of HPr-rel-A system
VQVQLFAPTTLHWRHWSNEYVVFDEFSGVTHLLDSLTACTLLCIEDGITDFDALVKRISELTSLTDLDVSEALSGVFEQLVAASLIKISSG